MLNTIPVFMYIAKDMSDMSAQITLQSMADGKQYWQHLQNYYCEITSGKYEY